MKYNVKLKSCVIIDAETAKAATEEVDDTLEDARERNGGGIEDEMVANASIVKVTAERSDDN